MRVLQVVPSLALRHGGVSVSVRELSRGLAQLGVSVEIWSTPRGYDAALDSPQDEQLRQAGVAVRYFPVSSLPWLGQRYAYSAPLGRALRQETGRCDLLHIHSIWLYPTLAASRACRSYGVPYVLSPCGALDPYSLSVRRAAKQLYGAWFERKNLQGAAALHFTSPQEQRRSETFGSDVRSAVIPRSLDLSRIPEIPAEQRPEWGGRKVLLFLGRLHPKKRLDIAVEAFARLCKLRGDVQLVIAGADEGSAPAASRIAAEAGVRDRVSFLGMAGPTQRWALYKSASLFLLPSEDENFGMSALEAMACGVPVLLSAHVGLAEEVSSARAGRVLNAGPDEWATAAHELLERPGQAAEMGQAGRRLVEQKFSTREVAGRMKALYESLHAR